MSYDATRLLVQVRRLSGHHAVELTLTPGWCLASVAVKRKARNGRFVNYNIGRGGRTQSASLRRLAEALLKEIEADG